MTNAAQEGAERGAAAPGTPDEGDQSMFDVFGKKYGIPGSKVVGILSATSFRLDKDGKAPTVEQIVALIAVCNAYDLNPFTKEIYAFPDSKKNSVIPVVSVDGWLRIINSHKQLDGFEFIYSPSMVRYDVDLHPKLGGLTHPAHEWIECVITRKDRSKPIVVREYLDECYKKADPAGPWQSHTNRFLRHKALIQCARYAFGFAGIYDEDEAKRIIEASIDDDEAAAAVKKPQVEMPESTEIDATVLEGDKLIQEISADGKTAIYTHKRGDVVIATRTEPIEKAVDLGTEQTLKRVDATTTTKIADPRIDKATTFDPPKTITETETVVMKGTNEIVDVEEEPVVERVDQETGEIINKGAPAPAPVKTDDEPFPAPAPAAAAVATTPEGDALIAPSRRNLMLSRMTFHDVTEDAMKKKWGVVPAEVLHKQYVEIMNWIEQGGK